MSTLSKEIDRMALSNNAKSLLYGVIDEEQSILHNRFAEGLYRSLLKDIRADGGMLSFLMSLIEDPDDRYIKIPHYIPTKDRKLKDNEMVLEEYGKYGILLNAVSNKKSFNFSIRLKDLSIVKFNYELRKMERGSFRSFTLTDKYGNISNNWKTLKVFQMHETKQIFDNHSKHDKRFYTTFVNDSLASKIFDIRYFLLKCYINRLTIERDYWKNLKEKASERISNFDAEYEINLIKKEFAEREGEEQ